MFAGVTCVAAVLVAAVFAVPSTRERRSYSEGEYWRGSVEDASVAGDGILSDCSDDDSDSVELAYIINKRAAPEERLPRRPSASPRARARARSRSRSRLHASKPEIHPK